MASVAVRVIQTEFSETIEKRHTTDSGGTRRGNNCL
jgi:hypothetical protein